MSVVMPSQEELSSVANQVRSSAPGIDVSILIVCYKSRDLILDCLKGVFEHTRGCTFEVLLLDCSNDGALELAQEAYPDVRIIENSENLGYGLGNNVLGNHATGNYILLLNPDVIIHDNAIGELFETAQRMPNAGAIGGRTRLRDGSRDPSSRQSIPTLTRLALSAVGCGRFINGALPEDAQEAAEVETLSGAFMLVRSDVWRQTAGFDTTFFMYSEEMDLCQRIHQLGYSVVMTPRAEVVHLVGSGNAHSPRRVQLIVTARMHFLRKFWSRPASAAGGVLIWLHGLFRMAIATAGGILLRSQRWQQLRAAYYPIVFRPGLWWHGFQGDKHYQ